MTKSTKHKTGPKHPVPKKALPIEPPKPDARRCRAACGCFSRPRRPPAFSSDKTGRAKQQ